MSGEGPTPGDPGPPTGVLAAAWARFPRSDRWFYGLVLLLWLVGLATPPVWGAFDEQVRVSANVWKRIGLGPEWAYAPGSFSAPNLVDPWGRELSWERDGRWILSSARRSWLYSVGPNGIDEHGRGDDIRILPNDHARIVAYRGLPSWASLLAFVLVVGWELWRFLVRPTRQSFKQELVGAALGGLVVGGAAWAGVVVALRTGLIPANAVASLEGWILVPLEVATGTWLLLAATGLLLWFRLRPAKEAP